MTYLVNVINIHTDADIVNFYNFLAVTFLFINVNTVNIYFTSTTLMTISVRCYFFDIIDILSTSTTLTIFIYDNIYVTSTTIQI